MKLCLSYPGVQYPVEKLVVLSVSDKKFEELCVEHRASIHSDAGLTEVAANERTAAAWLCEEKPDTSVY